MRGGDTVYRHCWMHFRLIEDDGEEEEEKARLLKYPVAFFDSHDDRAIRISVADVASMRASR